MGEMLRLRRQLFVESVFYNRSERSEIFPASAVNTAGIQRACPRWDGGLPRVVVEPLIRPCPASASNALVARANARTTCARQKARRGYPGGRTLKSVIESRNAGKRLASRWGSKWYSAAGTPPHEGRGRDVLWRTKHSVYLTHSNRLRKLAILLSSDLYKSRGISVHHYSRLSSAAPGGVGRDKWLRAPRKMGGR
jgi:hypothetical protein